MQAAVASKRKLGMDMLHEWAMAFGALAAKHQPVVGNEQHADEAKFEKWAKLSMEAAALKAPYETPRLKAIAVQRMPDEPLVPPPKTIDHVADAITPQEAYRVAMNLPPESQSAEVVPLKKTRRA